VSSETQARCTPCGCFGYGEETWPEHSFIPWSIPEPIEEIDVPSFAEPEDPILRVEASQVKGSS